MGKLKLSVVIPAYNEEKNLDLGTLDEVYDYLKVQNYSFEVLIIDDGSTDNTADVVEKIIKNKKNFRLVRDSHGGKAATVISGMQKAQGDIALFTDMDQATPLDQIEKFWPKFEEGFDIVIGSRQGRAGAPVIRKITAFGFATIRRIILGLPFHDTQCGFKAFNQKAIKKVFPKLESIWEKRGAEGAAVNAGFDAETLFIAHKMGFRIVEVPVNWHHVGTERISLVKDAIEAIIDMIRVRINNTRGGYD